MSYNPNNYTRCEKCKHIDRENGKCKITNDNWLVSDRAGTCRQFEGVENMKVRAKSNIEGAWYLEVTEGKIYDVIREDGDRFTIMTDRKVERSYCKSWFEIVEDEKLGADLSSKYHVNTCDKAKQFEESMKKVSEMASRCGVSSDDYWSIAIEDNRNECNPIKPNHYKAGNFDVIAFCFEHDLDFATGNIIKYVTRAGKKNKDKTLEDLLKAKEYLERKIERVIDND